MPVKIVDTNSDQVVNDDKTIKYSYTINDLNENNSIMIGFKVPNIQNIVIALVIIILIIVIIIIYYIKKEKNKIYQLSKYKYYSNDFYKDEKHRKWYNERNRNRNNL